MVTLLPLRRLITTKSDIVQNTFAVGSLLPIPCFKTEDVCYTESVSLNTEDLFTLVICVPLLTIWIQDLCICWCSGFTSYWRHFCILLIGSFFGGVFFFNVKDLCILLISCFNAEDWLMYTGETCFDAEDCCIYSTDHVYLFKCRRLLCILTNPCLIHKTAVCILDCSCILLIILTIFTTEDCCIFRWFLLFNAEDCYVFRVYFDHSLF